MIRQGACADRSALVVVGSSGRLGVALTRHFRGCADLILLGRGDLDLADPGRIVEVLEALDFSHLLLTGALTAVDYCESHPEEAQRINADAAGLIARICTEKHAHMTYISSDFVFDGSIDRAYTEEDEARPISVYGESKLAGELAVLASSPGHLVVRTSWLFGADRPAFPEWIIRQACESGSEALLLPEEKIGCPTYAEDLAALLEPLIFDSSRASGGVFHLCNSDPCSWREWGQACIDLAVSRGLPVKVQSIQPGSLDLIESFVARRPVSSALCTKKYTRLTGIKPRPWRSALSDHLFRQSHHSLQDLVA